MLVKYCLQSTTRIGWEDYDNVNANFFVVICICVEKTI